MHDFDLPVVAPIAERTIAAAGLAERVVTASGDFFVDPFPRAEVITMSLILHDWDLARKMHLIRSAYQALPEGGAFIAIEFLIDDARRENAFGLMMSLNMLIQTGGGVRLHRRGLRRLVPPGWIPGGEDSPAGWSGECGHRLHVAIRVPSRDPE